jgi:hypothetical protein
MRTDHAESLLLVAREEADLEVVSALLQDAIIAGADMHYDAQDNCFIIVANRFCWERAALAHMNTSKGGAVHERVLCGVRINHVTAVQKRRWPADWRDAFLNLLALKLVAMSQQDSGYMIELSFSAGPSMRLTTKQIDVVVGDLDGGHPTNLQPRHDL